MEKHIEIKLSELSEYEGIRIKFNSKRKERQYYAIKHPDEASYSYAGDAHNPEIQAVQEYNFYKEMLLVIERNIGVMEDFLGVYRQTNADSINDLLPKVYRLSRNDTLLKFEPEVDQWLREKIEHKRRYPVFNPAGLT